MFWILLQLSGCLSCLGSLYAQEDCIQLDYADALDWFGVSMSEVGLTEHRDIETAAYDSDF